MTIMSCEFESPSLHIVYCGNSSVVSAFPCHVYGLEFESRFPLFFELMIAQVAELVDAHFSGACVERHAGSSPVLGTLFVKRASFAEIA